VLLCKGCASEGVEQDKEAEEQKVERKIEKEPDEETERKKLKNEDLN